MIDVQDLERLGEEQQGGREKFWVRLPDERLALVKFPRENTGEHWAEILASVIGDALGIAVQRVELARYKDQIVTLHHDIRGGKTLVHGNEVLHGNDPSYIRDKRFKNCDHTWSRVHAAIVSRNADPAQLFDYLALDALIGNVDRHHENWALLQDNDGSYVIAPSYDHASSLGRELSQDKKAQWLTGADSGWSAGQRAQWYVNSGTGAMWIEAVGDHGPSPLALFQAVAAHHRDWHARIKQRWASVGLARLLLALDQAHLDIMSDNDRLWVRYMISYSYPLIA